MRAKSIYDCGIDFSLESRLRTEAQRRSFAILKYLRALFQFADRLQR